MWCPSRFNITSVVIQYKHIPFLNRVENIRFFTTSYNCGNTFLDAISGHETTINLFDWFCYNNFKANPSKCYLFLSPFNLWFINIKRSSTEGSTSEKFLWVIVDSNFTFEKHINELNRNTHYLKLLKFLFSVIMFTLWTGNWLQQFLDIREII